MGAPQRVTPPPVQVTPPDSSRLYQLMSMLPAAEAALAEAKQAADQIKAGIESEAVQLASGLNGGQIPYGIRIAGVLGLPARIMRWHGSETTFDKDRFEAENPGVLARYRRPKKPYWKMDREGS